MKLCFDSRKVEPGDTFFCIKGTVTDGHLYAGTAADKGAAVIVYSDEPMEKRPGVKYIKVDDTVEALDNAAREFFGDPSRDMVVFGVTGTNGKTTTARIISQVFSLYRKCGFMGTIGLTLDGKTIREASLTTPDALTVQESLAQVKSMGGEAMAMEISAQGITQRRVDCVDFDCGIFTNFTQDHLDNYGTMENYFNAKKRFFQSMKKDGTAVLNRDIQEFGSLRDACSCTNIVTYGLDEKDRKGLAQAASADWTRPGSGDFKDKYYDGTASSVSHVSAEEAGVSTAASAMTDNAFDPEMDYRASDIVYEVGKTSFNLCHGDQVCPVTTNLMGSYNVYNLLAAAAAMNQMGMELQDIAEGFSHINQIPGRMQAVDEGQDFSLYVDYAHTPDGYYQILSAVRNLMPVGSRLIVVAGAPGGRDHSKRKELAEIAGEFADFVVLTTYDVRKENPDDIVVDLLTGIKDVDRCISESNRIRAIQRAVALAEPGDFVFVLNKGVESFMYGPDGRMPYKGDDYYGAQAIREKMDGQL